jgi:hypothetical protein
MSGSATFTIVTSIRSMNVPVQTATSGNHFFTARACPRCAPRNQLPDVTRPIPGRSPPAPATSSSCRPP